MLDGRLGRVIDGGVEDERRLGDDRRASGNHEAGPIAGRRVDRLDQDGRCDLRTLVSDDLGVRRQAVLARGGDPAEDGSERVVRASLEGHSLAAVARIELVFEQVADGHGVTLAITEHGLAAIGIEPEASRDSAEPTQSGHAAVKTSSKPNAREGSKQAQLIAMLQGADGATVGEIAAAFGWQPHTVRGAIAGALKKKLGLDVTSEKVDGRGRVYRLSREG